MTPLYKTLEKYASLIYGDTRNEVEDIRKGLSSFSHSGPFYFHGHVFMPHSPYTKDKNCRISNSTKTSGIFGNPAADAHGYSEYLQCTNTQVKKFVDEIVKRDPDAFIIIQSDHGSEILWQGGEKEYPLEAFEERYANFNAWRMPKNCMKFFPPRMTPINTFPLVFSCLTGQEPQFLPNLAYRVFGTTEKLQLVRKNEKWLLP